MLALANDYFWPHGDVISQRIIAVKKSIHQNRADYVFQSRAETHREQRRPLLLDDYTPIMSWLLRQEALYQEQVKKPQPKREKSPLAATEQPVYHVYHLRKREVPRNVFYSALCKVVNYAGSFYDCLRYAWDYAHN